MAPSSEHAEGAHWNRCHQYPLLRLHSDGDFFPEDINIKSAAPEKIVQEEHHAEAWLMQFFEGQIRAACKEAFGKNDDATMQEHHLMDDSKRVVHSSY